jgi:catechol 2,3-dioxygenase-like lactoylglutathione lyase family enzyme
MIKGIHHVGLTLADARETAQFYADAAQFVALNADTLHIPVGNNVIEIEGASWLQAPNAYLRLLEPLMSCISEAPRKDRREVAEAGIVHVCLQSVSIEDLYQKFERAGANFHAPPVDLGTGFLYSYARDNENNVVELEGVPPVWEDTTPWVAHVSFSSADIDRLADFYAKVFGQTAIKSPRFGPSRRMDLVSGMVNTEFRAAWIPAGNMQIEVIQYFVPPTLANNAERNLGDVGYSYVCFEVDDMSASIAHLHSLGATQSAALAKLTEPNRYFCADPDGNILLLLSLGTAEREFAISKLPDATVVNRMAAALDARKARLQEQKAKP